MQLTGLLPLLLHNGDFREAAAAIGASPVTLSVIRSARPVTAAALYRALHVPVIYVTGSIRRAYDVSEQLPVWLGSDAPILRFTEPAATFYQHAPWGEASTRSRLETLSALAFGDTDTQPFVVTSARALMQPTIPFNQFHKNTLQLKRDAVLNIDRLLRTLQGTGYEGVTLVTEPGQFSRRGGVVDVYPVAADLPVRLEFFGDTLDSLRSFDPSTQRTRAKLDSVVITPAREVLPQATPDIAPQLTPWFDGLPEDSDIGKDREPLTNGTPFPHLEFYLPYVYPRPVSLLDYAPENRLIIIEDFEELHDTIRQIAEASEQSRLDYLRDQRLPEQYGRPYLDWDALEGDLIGTNTASFTAADGHLRGLFVAESHFSGQLKPALGHVRSMKSERQTAIVVSQQTARIADLWRIQDPDGIAPLTANVSDPLKPGDVQFVHGSLQEGWVLTTTPRLHLITDAELFGWSRPEPRRRKAQRVARVPETDYADWREGDYVVHVDYGIGRFGGMRHQTINGIDREYLMVEYGGNDVVFVPIHQADRLTRYIGVDDKPPTLHRLGKPDWENVRNRIKKAVEEDARELLALYAERAEAPGFGFAPDDHMQHELEASFPFIETDDQLRAVREVKADMEKSMPMDRLICGDVGYGKTEVALRAAFKAVNGGKQVAVLVPTTLLASQHYETFRNRLSPFPVRVELMSRFRSKEDQERILPSIASGEVDILIGTHRLLSSDITLRDLGLVIIDEEQRFGVKQKEHFKKLRTQVDVLTLTATPIPRTLYMSLTGVRDISMIQTPPEERLPVITHVGTFNEQLVRQAILRELERGGQIFVVHNRVKTIDALREQLEEIVPEARMATAHGQMNERTLEKVMSAFARGEFDVLISTAIVENGIDIPNANTLIVDRADWFGLAQLYQLRGRVGRGAQQAYAYFFYHKSGRLTDEARERLNTLAENTHLGAGYQIAMRDLEIRGAGDILSTRQTGHVAAVGLNLYTQLLTQAIQKLKGSRGSEPMPPAATSGIIINLPLPAYIPQDWITEISLRLQIYRRIGDLYRLDQVDDMERELQDRFGKLPDAVAGLLYQIRVKLLAQRAGATAVTLHEGLTIQVKLPYLYQLDRVMVRQELGDDVQVTRTAIEIPLGVGETWRTRLLEVLEALAQRGIAAGTPA